LNTPKPALVSHRAAQRMPRWALLLFCAAYVLPGLFGRDPWRSADATSFGYMLSIAEGRSPWTAPAIAQLAADSALLPYWLGAAFIQLLSPWVDPALAARLPFAALLGLVLMLTWYSTYHLARTEAAQPIPFAFGGEANPVDYARAIADGAVLAVIASLGLLQLGHETTPELLQLACVGLFLYALSASPYRGLQAKLAVLVSLPALVASGAPSMTLAMGVCAIAVCAASSYDQVRRFALWVLASTLLACAMGVLLDAWGWRVGSFSDWSKVTGVIKQWAWFLWPAWPLAALTIWRWRKYWRNRHISIPLSCLLVCLVSNVVMGGSDRALMLGVPALAILAAFALPTLQRATSSAIDWFSVFLFTAGALLLWVHYLAQQTGMPVKPAANMARLVPGYEPSFSALGLLIGAAATVAWLGLVAWRIGRNRHPLWKSLVLPAGGVALCWSLVATLLISPVNYARSDRALVQRIAEHVPSDTCVVGSGVSRPLLAALEYMGRMRVEAAAGASAASTCEFLLRGEGSRSVRETLESNWVAVAQVHRPSDKDDRIGIYRRKLP
jgi:4-amino-4-deoxy-L-arabinose transferase-like glycosyltransferase